MKVVRVSDTDVCPCGNNPANESFRAHCRGRGVFATILPNDEPGPVPVCSVIKGDEALIVIPTHPDTQPVFTLMCLPEMDIAVLDQFLTTNEADLLARIQKPWDELQTYIQKHPNRAVLVSDGRNCGHVFMGTEREGRLLYEADVFPVPV